MYSVLLTLWLYCSAIFYPVDSLSGFVKEMVVENPIFNYINCVRKVVMWGEMPTETELLRMILWGVISYLIGSIVFKMKKNQVMQKI